MKISASSNRVTLRFSSDQGREYLYDDITGSIFPWNDLREKVLKLALSNTFHREDAALAFQYGEKNVRDTYRFIEFWRKRYGSFVRAWNEDYWQQACPTAHQLEQYIRSRSSVLVLILTEDCNLRCKYCVLSRNYPLNRVRTARRMDVATAKRAVDWYVKLVEPQIIRNPQKRFGLSFYGGEPLMNMPVLHDILRHSRRHYPDIFEHVMTTNGTLLGPKNIEILAQHDVQLAISIDGPQAEHDRRRRDAQNSGTFEKILKNLRRIKQDYPEYWASKITSVSVYDWGTDPKLVEKFFAENEDLIPRSVFVNPVSPYNTDWYKQYTEHDKYCFELSLAQLREKYKRAKINNDSISHYMNCAVGMEVLTVHLRPRVGDHRPPFLPFSGACIPGDRIAIHVDGKIDMCERVNGKYPIGHLNGPGIDWECIKDIIEEYQRHVLLACPQCAATRLCSICFSHVERNAGFGITAATCAQIEKSAIQRLTDYVSILEENPEADFGLETNTAYLGKRLFS